MPRHFYHLLDRNATKTTESGPPKPDWADTRIVLPDDFPQPGDASYRAKTLNRPMFRQYANFYAFAELLDVFPVAVLKSR